MLNGLRLDVTEKLSLIRPVSPEEQQEAMARYLAQQQAAQAAVDAAAASGSHEAVEHVAAPGFVEAEPATWGNPSRNDPCPCGSGEKFKHCHGRLV